MFFVIGLLIVLMVAYLIQTLHNSKVFIVNIDRNSDWKAEIGKVYFYITDIGEVEKASILNEEDIELANARIYFGNCFLTDENAEIVADKIYSLIGHGYVETFSNKKIYN